jgi:hypothetical protein
VNSPPEGSRISTDQLSILAYDERASIWIETGVETPALLGATGEGEICTVPVGGVMSRTSFRLSAA